MTRIVLNKQTHTIKVVNRKDNIRLRRQTNNISLTQTGRRGPQGIQGIQGIQGYTGVSTMMRVQHGINGATVRPDAQYVEWMGSVIPANATSMDTWIVTP